MSPWINLYYVVTGKNALGQVINGDQTLGRRRLAPSQCRDEVQITVLAAPLRNRAGLGLENHCQTHFPSSLSRPRR